MYQVISRPNPAKDLLAFNAVAKATYMRGAKKVTTKGDVYPYCCMQSGNKIYVYANESSCKSDYDSLNLLKIIGLDSNNQLSNNEIYRIALNAI